MNDLNVITLTKLELKNAVSENKYWNNTFEPPFSVNKAKWILENERAEDNDVLAVLGYEDKSIVAFVYLVPDLIRGGNGVIKKIFWSQRWWVSNKYKDTVLSAYIKGMSLNASSNQVAIKFLGDNTKAYYKKQPFKKFAKRKRYINIFSLDSGLLIYKKASLQKFLPLLKLIDNFTRSFIALVNKVKVLGLASSISFFKIKSINDEVWLFLEKHCISDLVPKSKSYINWQISNKQYFVLNKNTQKPEYKCLLGSISNKIYNQNIVIKNKEEIVGFISAYVSGKRFIIRYFVVNNMFYKDCVKVLIKNFIQSKSTIFQTEDATLGKFVKSNYFNLYSDVKELVSLIHNDVDINLAKSTIKDQDGNMF